MIQYVSMRRLLLFALFVVLPIDLAVVDTPLSQAGARSPQWDDEEESAPSRRQRAGEEQRHVDVLPPGQRSVEPDRAERWAKESSRADGRHRAVAWLVPIRQALLPACASASPPEDH